MSLEAGAEAVQLRASRVRSWLLGLLFLAFAGIGIVATSSAPEAWFGVVFFGVLAAATFATVLPAAAGLTLAPEGFTVRSFFRGTLTPWAAVRRFRVGRQPGRGAAVVYEKREPPGEEDLLPDNYGMAADELAALLERWRQAHRGR